MERFQKTLSFDDILITPQYSTIESRKNIDISSQLDDKITLKLPIIASPMDTISEDKMVIAMALNGGMAIVHRYNTLEKQEDIIFKIKKQNEWIHFGVAIGTKGDFLQRVKEFYLFYGVKTFCIDTAHAHHILMERAIKSIRDSFVGDKVHIMAGNIATGEAFQALEEWGADSVRLNIGSGAICATRINTGHGVSGLQTLLECSKIAKKAKIIVDGGIKNAGDICKAFGLGADFVMLGSLLAGTDECPVPKVYREGKYMKEYRGMASRKSKMNNNSLYSIEGIETYVDYKGPVQYVLKGLEENIKSGLSYSGANNLQEFCNKAIFTRQTTLGQRESDTHILYRK